MQRFVMGEKYFTLFRVNTKKGRKKKQNRNTGENRREKKSLTRERRTDFSPADISKVQKHALLQRVKNVFTGYRIW
jgi:hypothetical protein